MKNLVLISIMTILLSLAFTACVKKDFEGSANPEIMAQSTAVRHSKDYYNNSFKTYYLKQNEKGSKGLEDSIPVIDSIPTRVPSIKICDTVQYIKFRSFWTDDLGQANVYEIEAFSGGINVALNKPAHASSNNYNDKNDIAHVRDSVAGFGEEDPSYGRIFHIDDGNTLSRWSSDRYLDSNYSDTLSSSSMDYMGNNRAYIIVDLTQKYLIDSVRLYLFTSGVGSDTTMWTAHKQSFGLYGSKDVVKWDSIGGGVKVNQLNWVK